MCILLFLLTACGSSTDSTYIREEDLDTKMNTEEMGEMFPTKNFQIYGGTGRIEMAVNHPRLYHSITEAGVKMSDLASDEVEERRMDSEGNLGHYDANDNFIADYAFLTLEITVKNIDANAPECRAYRRDNDYDPDLFLASLLGYANGPLIWCDEYEKDGEIYGFRVGKGESVTLVCGFIVMPFLISDGINNLCFQTGDTIGVKVPLHLSEDSYEKSNDV
jgi:hypothetical protein